MNACGCHQCGGSAARADALLARRVLAYAGEVAYRRRSTASDLANRSQRPDLYSRLVMERARGYGIAPERE